MSVNHSGSLGTRLCGWAMVSLASRIGLSINCRLRVVVFHFRRPFVANPIIPNGPELLRPLGPSVRSHVIIRTVVSRASKIGSAIRFGDWSVITRRFCFRRLCSAISFGDFLATPTILAGPRVLRRAISSKFPCFGRSLRC